MVNVEATKCTGRERRNGGERWVNKLHCYETPLEITEKYSNS
jgi:hypothetical protein